MSAVVAGWTLAPPVSGRDDRIWLRSPSGEGGDFNRAEVEDILARGFAGDVAAELNKYFWERF